MAISAWTGPVGAFGQNTQAPGQDYNGEAGPSFFFDGTSILDPRTPFTYQPGQRAGSPVQVFTTTVCDVINQVPSTLQTNNIAAAQVGAVGVLALVSSTGAGITVGASVVNFNTGQPVTGLLVIDGATASVPFGSVGTVNAWDSRTLIARALRYTSAGVDTSATATTKGFDIYGVPMTETVTLGSGSTITGKKAFKYIQSITIGGTPSGSNISVGTSDIYGLPIKADQYAYLSVFWNSTFAVASTGFTVPDATTPATAATGDVRGTYLLQGAASNNTLRLSMEINVPAYALALGTTGLFGVTQF